MSDGWSSIAVRIGATMALALLLALCAGGWNDESGKGQHVYGTELRDDTAAAAPFEALLPVLRHPRLSRRTQSRLPAATLNALLIGFLRYGNYQVLVSSNSQRVRVGLRPRASTTAKHRAPRGTVA